MQDNLEKVEINLDESASEKSNADGPAMLFSFYWPIVSNKIDTLSNNSLRRLLKAIICIPLEDAKLNLKLVEEREVYAICERLMEAKLVMTLTALYENQDELKKLSEDSQQTPKENNDGEIKAIDGR